ncbi:MAG: zf-HC2 domain-containing protein [Gemmatimonadetes bacterium]|nr:zf-HC2 domain-containing protein [Gemmatimonadota bacterium]MBL0179122.1 zf-HC2 domain-containing protein [Gemmatimonadota bacterium]
MSDPELNCTDALAELDAFLRGELPVESVERMQGHLTRCRHCTQIGRYEQAFRSRLQRLGAGTECPDALRARIAALLAEGPSSG